MAILAKNQQETTPTSLSTSTPSKSSSNTSNKKRQSPPLRRQAIRHASGNLSDATASTTSSSDASSSQQQQQQQPKKNRTNRNRRRARPSKRNGNTKASKVNSQPELSPAEQARYIALDCEFVGVGYQGRTSVLARVSMVDWNGHVLLDEYVQPHEPVTDYRTYVSGITAQHLEHATHTFETIQPIVAEMLQGKILVGHGLKADLQVLQLSHPWYDTRDTAKYEPFMQVRFDDGILWPRKLRDLCATRPHLDVPADFQQGAHCSVADAIAALRLYQSVRLKWERVMDYKKSKTMQITKQQQEQQQSVHHQDAFSSDDDHFDEFSHSDESSQASSL